MKPPKLSYFEKMAPYNYHSNLYASSQAVPFDQDYEHLAVSCRSFHFTSQSWALSYLGPVRHHI